MNKDSIKVDSVRDYVVEIGACPFCGDYPTIETLGSCIDIECCVTMSIQKCDVLTIEERQTYNPITHLMSRQAEIKALEYIVNNWNTRV